MTHPPRDPHRLLRLLLDDESIGDCLAESEWREMLTSARSGGVLLRLIERIDRSAPLPSEVAAAAEAERRRVAATMAVIRRVTEACTARRIPHVFVSALQHRPDIGLDVDLLVPSLTAVLTDALDESLGSAPLARGFGARLSGAVTYPGGGEALPVDVHLGRLGVAGEHVDFATALLDGDHVLHVDRVPVPVPTPDDQMVLQGMNRLYGRRLVRAGDLVTTVNSIRRDELDWDHILARAHESGTVAGLSCYLRFADAAHRSVLDRPLLAEWLLDQLEPRHWGSVSLRDGALRFAALRVSGQLYPRAFVSQVRTHNWLAAARLCLVPAVAAEASLRRVVRRSQRLVAPWGTEG